MAKSPDRPADIAPRSGERRPRRAAANDGRRTTLRVPPEVALVVDRIAERDGVTPNAALIRLAELGANADARSERREQARAEALAALAAHAPRSGVPADFDPERAGEALGQLIESELGAA